MPAMDTIESEVDEKVQNHFNGEYTFDAKELKTLFPKLEPVDDFTLVPMIDRLARELIVDLKQRPSEYPVLTFKYIGRKKGPARIYELVAGDEKHKGVVSMDVCKTDINPISSINSYPHQYNRHCWMTNKLRIKGNKPQVEIFSNLIKNFAQNHNLERLIQDAKQELVDIRSHRKEEFFEIINQFDEFYFEEGEKLPSDEYFL